MSPTSEKPPKIGTEITVRISLTFQEAPDVHTLLAMTPVRERGKLVRLALERYIEETAHPAGDVEQQIEAISTWLRSRGQAETIRGGAGSLVVACAVLAASPTAPAVVPQPPATSAAELGPTFSSDSSPSINRWLQM